MALESKFFFFFKSCIKDYNNSKDTKTTNNNHSRPGSLNARLPIRPERGITIRGGLHGLGEGGGEVAVEVDDTPDVVVELPDEPHVPAEVDWDLGLMVLIDLVYQQPVLIQNALNLDKVLLKALQDLCVHLGSPITHPRVALSLHFQPNLQGYQNWILDLGKKHAKEKEEKEPSFLKKKITCIERRGNLLKL